MRCKRPITILFITALLLMACSDNSEESQIVEEQDSEGASNSLHQKEDKSKSVPELEEAVTDDSKGTSSKEKENKNSNDQSKVKEDSVLSEYSSNEIEYARVWLQIVGNKDIEELNVRHISAGEQVNPYDDDSVDYPEDVIALGGKIMAAGTVTYSGNGDGTINLYNVPSHWPNYKQIDVSMEKYTEDIIKNTEQIYIDPGDDEEIIKVIKKLNIGS
ncbi:hypothetical protein ACW2QC_17545 [Virgibacillus sp. FSP13]